MANVEVLSARISKNTIKRALDVLGLSQEEAARRVNVSYRHFNRVALGQAEPTLLVAAKMALVLGTTIDALFTVKMTTRARGM